MNDFFNAIRALKSLQNRENKSKGFQLSREKKSQKSSKQGWH